jgi:esterase/lipase superfamily enzyme
LKKHVKRALAAGQKIAGKNGRNLSLFIQDFKSVSPTTRIRLLGHSLGSQVILSTIKHLAKKKQNKGMIDSVYFFGASITSDVPSSKKHGILLDRVIKRKIVNYYCPTDEVLKWANTEKFVKGPLGLDGAIGKTIPKYHQKLVHPENHRFASYAKVLESFP